MGTLDGCGRADLDVCGKIHPFHRQLAVLTWHDLVVTAFVVVRQRTPCHAIIATSIGTCDDGSGAFLVDVILKAVNGSGPIAPEGTANAKSPIMLHTSLFGKIILLSPSTKRQLHVGHLGLGPLCAIQPSMQFKQKE